VSQPFLCILGTIHRLQTQGWRLACVPRAVLPLALAFLLAGCSNGGSSDGPPEADVSQVEGWVMDDALAPVAGASIIAQGLDANTTTDEDGHFALTSPAGSDLLLVVAAPGFVTQSRFLGAYSGAHAWLNLTLKRIPFAAPYHLTSSYTGAIQCGATATVGEDPNSPHEHRGIKCTDAAPSSAWIWNYTIPFNVTALVVEAFWEPSTPSATALILKAVIPETGELLAFVEGTNPIKQQLSQVNLAQNLAAGHTRLAIQMTPGAGTGGHDHGAIGVFFNQQFTLYMTEFYNGPADPAFTISDA
jgi:hypothetical protein